MVSGNIKRFQQKLLVGIVKLSTLKINLFLKHMDQNLISLNFSLENFLNWTMVKISLI